MVAPSHKIQSMSKNPRGKEEEMMSRDLVGSLKEQNQCTSLSNEGQKEEKRPRETRSIFLVELLPYTSHFTYNANF